MTRPFTASLAAIAVAVSTANAQQRYEDWQAIDNLTAIVAGAMGRTAAPVDRRIKLQRCPEQATITAIDAQTLAVRCPSLGWRVRVPMAGGAAAASESGMGHVWTPVPNAQLVCSTLCQKNKTTKSTQH